MACINAICWSILTPPFQIPDEPSHFGYVQELAQSRRLPIPGPVKHSESESVTLQALHQLQVHWHPEVHAISSSAEQKQLEQVLNSNLSTSGDGHIGVAASQPPLYYALELVPYELGSVGSLLDQLELMRLLSALMAAVTGLFAYMFVRETLPGAPWAWLVGGLSVSLAPLFGFMSGAVNPDALLFVVAAMAFYALARGFRRGLSKRLALVLGAVIAVGFLTKLNFLGLAPGLILGLILLAVRARRSGNPRALRWLAYALAIAVSPFALFALLNLVDDHGRLGIAASALTRPFANGSFFREISYAWQFYLPPLPGMGHHYFPGFSMTRIWFDRSVGLFGWLDTSFPHWVNSAALIPATLLLALACRGLVIGRAVLRERLSEALAYLAMGIGLMALVGASSYSGLGIEASGYVEPRYLLPLLPMLAMVLALAARGAGRRLGPAAGALIVLLFLAQDIFSQLLVVARFYS